MEDKRETYNYVEKEIAEHLICIICQEPMIDPVVEQNCQQMFCRSCLATWLKTKKTCPHCRSGIMMKDTVVPPRFIPNALNDLLVICHVCSGHVKRESLSSHINRCPKLCALGCGLKIAPIDEKEHDGVCTAKIVACPASDVGCIHRCQRGILSQHTSFCSVLPLRPILQQLQQQQQQIQQLQQEINFIKGTIYDTGMKVEKNDEKAMSYYQEAADCGHAESQYLLGEKSWTRDVRNAFRYFSMAATQQHASAQFSLGVMYATGQVGAKDERKAAEWYQKAADQRHAEAQYNLGWMYANGQGVAKDERKAVEWYQKAADQGNAIAQSNLGWMYDNGQGVAKDEKKAIEWYQKAADQGNADAQYNLGWMYDNGQGVAKDEKKAVEWYQKAADQRLAAAQYMMGVMYANGLGVSKDEKRAVKWYQQAADQGNAKAIACLAKMKH